MKDVDKKIKAYALKNALAYKGHANPGAVISSLFHEGLKKEYLKKYLKKINSIVQKTNELKPAEQEQEFKKLEKFTSKRKIREGLPELPNTKKGVVMRFAPSPSGPWHIGHIITVCLSALYVKKYSGKLYIRIEDTNPENIYKPAYGMIEKEANWLLKNINKKIVIQSDRMKLYYKYAEKLISKNKAYVCECSGERFRKYSKQQKKCPCRKKTIKQNKEGWKKMLDKNGFKQGGAILRFKSGMKDPNPAMRDFPLARINITPHPRVGNKYRVWPLMNLSVSVDDIEHKMTHVIRGKDHRDNAKRQKKIFKTLNKKIPWTAFIGRIKFKDLALSTTQIRKDIKTKKYSGWDDKKLPTLASLKRQGYKVETFFKLSEHIGISENDKVMDKKEFFQLLDTFNKK